jgi:iron(III) transport system permease protein
VLAIIAVHAESFLAFTRPETLAWAHIREHLLWGYIQNTAFVVFFSMFFTGIIGTLAAYLVSCFDFPLRKIVDLLLHLPLAIPPYIAAFVYADMLQFGGLIHGWTAGVFRLSSLWMAVLVFSLFLFPYVYISVKGYVDAQTSSLIENARLLKKSELALFFKVVLPSAQTALISGMILVGLVVLGDFGVSAYLGVHTFSTAIFDSWISFRDFDSSLRLSALVMLMVFSLLILQALLTRYKHKASANARSARYLRKRLKGIAAILAQLFIWTIIVASLGLPLQRLISWALLSYDSIRYTELSVKIFNTVSTALAATILIIVLALILAAFTRSSPAICARTLR